MDASRRSAAVLMGLVSALVLTTVAYVALAFDASKRNGSALTVVLSLIMFGLPAAILGTLACRLSPDRRRSATGTQGQDMSPKNIDPQP